MYKTLKRYIAIVISPIGLLVGWCVYFISGRTPNFAYQSMITLFCSTRGLSSDAMSKAIGIFRPTVPFAPYESVLGKSEEIDFGHIDQRLQEDGYFIFDNRLSDELCDKLLEFALTQKCAATTDKKRYHVFKRGAPQANRYNFKADDLLKDEEIQNLLADHAFADVAQRYLGARPKFDEVVMWWSTDFSKTPDEDAAQLFHFDMDKPKWIKFFFCLTDVEAHSGPHVFVKGSHKTNGIPSSMLKKGYSRLSDKEVVSHYGTDKIVEFIAKRGTIIAEDSRGLHKGKNLQKGDRLMISLQFSNSSFGNNNRRWKLGPNLTDELKASLESYPHLYENYTIEQKLKNS